MATKKQTDALRNLVKNGGNVSLAMRDAGYSPETAKTPKKLTHSKAFKSFAEYLPDKLLAKRHLELLNKREKVRIFDHASGEYVEQLNNQPDTLAVSKGLDMAYKIKGTYAPEKHLNLNVEVSPEEKAAAETALNQLNDKGGTGPENPGTHKD